MRLGLILTSIFFSAALVSCEKAIDEPQMQKDNARASKNSAVNSLNYGENILFLQKNPKKNNVAPLNVPSVQGYFRAIPNGLSIDRTTGAIDLSKSLTGLPFKIFYVSTAGKLVDSTRVIISGVDYQDGIYELGQKNQASPVYNANPSNPVAAGIADFDETDIDEDGRPDVAALSSRGVKIDRKSGAIDLAGSINSGLFGSGAPVNGATTDFSVLYRVKDGSNRALNKIDVKVYYFKTRADIPAELLELLQKRGAIDARVNKMPTPGFTSTDITTDPLADLDAYGAPRRPPLIIIIG